MITWKGSIAQEDHNFKITGAVIFTNAEMQQQKFSAPNFAESSWKRSYQLGVIYDRYFSNNNFGYRTGLQIGTQRYGVDFNIRQPYLDINGSNAELTVLLQTVPGYIVARLPLGLLYKKLLPNDKSFINFSAGISLDCYFLDVVVSESDLLLENPQGILQQFSVSSTNNLEFNSSLGYSFYLSSSFNFLFKKKRYLEFGISYFYSPVSFDQLELTHVVNNELFEANYRINRMDNLQITFGYYLTKFNK